MSETPLLADSNVGSELNAYTKSLADELVGNPALIKNSGENATSTRLRNLKLRFRSKLCLPILTGKPILSEDNSPLTIDLIDINTGLVVESGPKASARVEIVVLRVDSNDDDGQEWTSGKFVRNIMIENGKNKSLLKGNRFFNLNQGTGSVDTIYFTHGSIYTKKCDFMLGARFVNSSYGIDAKEAKSERFTLEDRRNKLNAKHQLPVLSDDVWRLKNISRRGKFHKRLEVEKIKTVKDLLIRYFSNRQTLQNILQMPDKVFDATVEHGLKCKRDKHIYRPTNSRENSGVVFDDVGQLLGVHSDNGFVSVENLSPKAKDDAQTSVAYAFENWSDVVLYDENFYKNPQESVVYDITQPSTSSLEIVDKSHLSYSYNDLDALYALQPADIEFLREILRSPLHDPEPEGQGFENRVIEDFLSNKEQKIRNKKWLKMALVVRFLLIMKSDKTDHARKRMRFQ